MARSAVVHLQAALPADARVAALAKRCFLEVTVPADSAGLVFKSDGLGWQFAAGASGGCLFTSFAILSARPAAVSEEEVPVFADVAGVVLERKVKLVTNAVDGL